MKGKDFVGFYDAGVMRWNGRDYRIFVNDDLPKQRRNEIEMNILKGSLELEGHICVPERRSSQDLSNTESMIRFLRGETSTEDRELFLP